MTRRWAGLALRAGVSGVLLYLLLRTVGTDDLVSRLRGMRPGWVLVALALSVGQVALSAWRWSFTAGRLGIRLPFRAALAEYYLASFLNQVLPGGVVGDVSRAWRHARSQAPEMEGERLSWPAVHAVIVERLSGQLAVFAVAIASVATLVAAGMIRAGSAPPAGEPATVIGGHTSAYVVWLGLLGGTVLLLAGAGWLGRRVSRPWGGAREGGWVTSTRTALFSPGTWRTQALTSSAVVASYMGVYLAGAAAVGVDTPAWVLAPLVAPVLLSMLIPVTVAGWGLREGAAVLLWSGVGLPAADGVALSVAYGLLVLVSTLPGALVLLIPGGDPGRREGRSPA